VPSKNNPCFLTVSEAGQSLLRNEDRVFGFIHIQIYFDRETQTAVIRDDKNKENPAVAGFWFAWYAFHPATEIFFVEQKY
jgi:hypothetical protein